MLGTGEEFDTFGFSHQNYMFADYFVDFTFDLFDFELVEKQGHRRQRDYNARESTMSLNFRKALVIAVPERGCN